MKSEEKVLAVQKMQDYIGKNINNNITLKDISDAVNYSKWYCNKIFKECLNKTPFEYIRMLRLTEAARILRDRKTKVIDVAFDFVFASHEGFTRAFSKQFGISPFCYKNNPVPLKYFIPHKFIDFDLILILNKKIATLGVFREKFHIFSSYVALLRPRQNCEISLQNPSQFCLLFKIELVLLLNKEVKK